MKTNRTLARIAAFSKAVVNTIARQQIDLEVFFMGIAYSSPIASILHTIKEFILAH